jgi:hypothetical protein
MNLETADFHPSETSRQPYLSFDKVTTLVVDEADLMLDISFAWLRRVLDNTSASRNS